MDGTPIPLAIREERFEAAPGISLYARSWVLPHGTAKAAVAIVHGFGEHCTRYDHVAARLNAEGYDVYSHDHRGHGNSPGLMGYIPSFDALVDDFGVFLSRVRAQIGGLPLFAIGHSMGGLILASRIVRHQEKFQGAVFSSSGLKVGADVSPVLQRVSGILAVILPKVPVHTLDPKAISRIPGEVRKYEEDPLVYHGKFLAKTGHELLRAVTAVQGRLNEIRLPFLAMHGSADRLVEVEASRMLHERAASTDKSLLVYEGAFHEVFNDLDRERFFRDMIDWLNARRGPA